jgi:hypothetical protein
MKRERERVCVMSNVGIMNKDEHMYDGIQRERERERRDFGALEIMPMITQMKISSSTTWEKKRETKHNE